MIDTRACAQCKTAPTLAGNEKTSLTKSCQRRGGGGNSELHQERTPTASVAARCAAVSMSADSATGASTDYTAYELLTDLF
jgi:hypothetical protein